MSSGISAYLGGILGLGNQVTTNSSACTTGTEALLMGFERIKNGKAKRIITSYMHLPNGQGSISNQNADLPYIVSGIEVLRDGMSVTATNISATINLEANL